MSSWRRKAIALFPEHRLEFARTECRPFDVFQRLLGDAIEAHSNFSDDPNAASAHTTLRRVHGFAEWCLHEPALWQEAAIGFYEDLFASVSWDLIVPWLSPFAADQVRQTWALGVGGERAPRFEELVSLAQKSGQHYYRSHVYSTGEVESL